jgi:hypothetical protein
MYHAASIIPVLYLSTRRTDLAMYRTVSAIGHVWYHQVIPAPIYKKRYSLRSILLFASMDVSRHILELDTSILMKSNLGRRE